jgi:hypothetical protein
MTRDSVLWEFRCGVLQHEAPPFDARLRQSGRVRAALPNGRGAGMRIIRGPSAASSTIQDVPGTIFSRQVATEVCRGARRSRSPSVDHQYGSDDDRGDVEDDVDAATPVDAQNAPTGVWKSRKQREIPTAPTSIIVIVQEEEERRARPLTSTVHRIGSPPLPSLAPLGRTGCLCIAAHRKGASRCRTCRST